MSVTENDREIQTDVVMLRWTLVMKWKDDSPGNDIKKHGSFTCLCLLMLKVCCEHLQYPSLTFIHYYFYISTWFHIKHSEVK